MQPEVEPITSREQAERAVRDLAEKTLDLLQERAALDEAVLAARKDRDKRIAALQTLILERESRIAEWAKANRDAEFLGQQSLALRHGILSFRKGTWFVALVEGFTWDRALDQLKKLKLRKFIRTKPEIDKRKLLQERETSDLAELKKAGLTFERGETFSIEPKLETVLPLKQAA